MSIATWCSIMLHSSLFDMFGVVPYGRSKHVKMAAPAGATIRRRSDCVNRGLKCVCAGLCVDFWVWKNNMFSAVCDSFATCECEFSSVHVLSRLCDVGGTCIPPVSIPLLSVSVIWMLIFEYGCVIVFGCGVFFGECSGVGFVSILWSHVSRSRSPSHLYVFVFGEGGSLLRMCGCSLDVSSISFHGLKSIFTMDGLSHSLDDCLFAAGRSTTGGLGLHSGCCVSVCRSVDSVVLVAFMSFAAVCCMWSACCIFAISVVHAGTFPIFPSSCGGHP